MGGSEDYQRAADINRIASDVEDNKHGTGGKGDEPDNRGAVRPIN
jgi:hypothetical protein